jgi:transaldolase
VQSVKGIYSYYKHFGIATEIMGASFRNTNQIMQLAGCDLLTISPELLAELQNSSETVIRKLDPKATQGNEMKELNVTESAFRLQLNDDAMATEKLAEGIRAFCSDIVKLEVLLNN